jgi:hypothetical protein
MNVITRDDLKLLIEKKTDGACTQISIFMPTFRAGTDMQQSPSRLRNLLREAEEKLVATGLRGVDALKILKPVDGVLNDAFFWRNQSDGLAIFCGPDFFRYYRVPVNLKEMVLTGNRFHVKPLFPLLTEDGKFYLLSVSQKDVKLYQCTRFGYREVSLPQTVPSSLAEAMKYEELDRSTQYHGHLGDAEYHGHIGVEAGAMIMTSHGKTITQEHKDRLLRFFRDIDSGLREKMQEENAPLVFAGVDYLFPIYRQSNTYAGLADKIVEGNPDKVSVTELHTKAWEVIRPKFTDAKKKALSRYEKLEGTGLTSTDIKNVAENAYRGKIEFLFLDENAEQWGVFDRDRETVVLHEAAEPCDEDMLDFALIHTILHKGNAFVLKKEELPGSLVAAVLRR